MADNADDTRLEIDANEAGLKAAEGTDSTRTESTPDLAVLPAGPSPRGMQFAELRALQIELHQGLVPCEFAPDEEGIRVGFTVISSRHGVPEVRTYDGSWTEWGNLVRTPIEKP